MSAMDSRRWRRPPSNITDALGKFLPDQDRPNEGVFSFQDDDEQWLSLRYDLTAPLARYVAQNFDALPKPYRSYRVGWVFRNEKPGPGRFRQFMQFDADTVGSASPAADAEICMMAADTMEALGHCARRLRREGEQPQGARRSARSHRACRRGECGQAAYGAARDRQAGSAGSRTECVQLLGAGSQGRNRRLHKRGGPGSQNLHSSSRVCLHRQGPAAEYYPTTS